MHPEDKKLLEEYSEETKLSKVLPKSGAADCLECGGYGHHNLGCGTIPCRTCSDRKKLHALEKMMAQIDYRLLREQKAWLAPQVLAGFSQAVGLINLIDDLQDKAVSAMGYTEEQVFGKEE